VLDINVVGILGPILFNLYVGKCMSGLEGCHFVSYADDSYVLNYGNTIDEAKNVATRNMIKHISNLRKAGMVVNQAKTEVIAFTRSKAVNAVEIDLDDGTRLHSARKIKALGIWIDDRLKWDAHVRELRKRIVKITSGLKLIRRKLNLKQAINVVTAQALSILYYASPSWLTPNIGKRELIDIERIHFKALRVAVCDYRQRLSRDTISVRTNRLPPRLWCQFAASTVFMKLWYQNRPLDLKQSIFTNTYTKTRFPGRLFGFDGSKLKIGKQVTKNWCGNMLSQIQVQWTESQMSKDRIRTILKSTFYPYNFIVFNY